MTNTSTHIRLFILTIASFAAIYMGVLVVTAQTEALMWVILAAGVALCVWLGRDIWLLIPATMSLNLLFPWLPGGFPPSRIAVLLAIGWCFLLIAMRRLPLRFKFTHVEFAALLLLATILQGYIRNPVGLASMGGDSVGAKPYLMVAISLMGAILLASLVVTPDRIRKTMLVMLAGSVFSTAVNLLAYLSSAVASITGPLLGAFGKGNPLQTGGIELGAVDESQATRIGPAIELSKLISRFITAKRDPFRALTHPLWGTLVLLALAAAAMSGYRNSLIATGLTFAFGTYYWGRFRAVAGAAFLGIITYVLLALINPIAPLPPNIQRSLTILPGPWEEQYKNDAKASTEWRTEMWMLALTTDRYIQNKILGDGMGMTQKEYRFLAGLADKKTGLSDEMTQERAMATQAYHSGPVQTVRVTGYVGLIILLYAMIVVAVRAHRLILRSRGTEWFGVVLFLVLHMVWHPLFFTFVFGAYGDDVPALLMNMGILRLIENNLPLPRPNTEAASARLLAWQRGIKPAHG